MRVQTVFTIVALGALAVLVGLVVRSALNKDEAAPIVANVKRDAVEQRGLPQIYVARTTLEVGTFMTKGDFEPRDWPETAILASHLRHGKVDPTTFEGSVVRERIVAGEPLLIEKLVKPGERGFLAAVLLPGRRAVSVGVDAVSGHSGLVLPGDRVDIILTQNLEQSGSNGKFFAGETIVRSVRVLAVGSRLDTPDEASDMDDRPRTVTLEVTPRQAEAIAVANAIGDISLSVRSLPATEVDTAEDQAVSGAADLSRPERPTFASDVSRALGGDPERSLIVMRGTQARPKAQ